MGGEVKVFNVNAAVKALGIQGGHIVVPEGHRAVVTGSLIVPANVTITTPVPLEIVRDRVTFSMAR